MTKMNRLIILTSEIVNKENTFYEFDSRIYYK